MVEKTTCKPGQHWSNPYLLSIKSILVKPNSEQGQMSRCSERVEKPLVQHKLPELWSFIHLFLCFFLPVPVMVWTLTVSLHDELHFSCSCRESVFSSNILLSLDVIKSRSSLSGRESKWHETLSNTVNFALPGVQPWLCGCVYWCGGGAGVSSSKSTVHK